MLGECRRNKPWGYTSSRRVVPHLLWQFTNELDVETLRSTPFVQGGCELQECEDNTCKSFAGGA